MGGLAKVSDLTDGPVSGVFAVRERETRQKRNGEDFLQLTLGDRTGTVKAVSWEEVAERRTLTGLGAIVWVRGEFKDDARWGATLTIRELRPAADGEWRIEDLVAMPETPVARLESDLTDLLETIQNPQLRTLLDRVFKPGAETWRRFREAPAAKYYHQAYRHGLLEHCLSVAQGVSATAATFPAIDRDLAVTGALLHDVGKIEAYAFEGDSIELTDAGRLQGEIALGY